MNEQLPSLEATLTSALIREAARAPSIQQLQDIHTALVNVRRLFDQERRMQMLIGARELYIPAGTFTAPPGVQQMSQMPHAPQPYREGPQPPYRTRPVPAYERPPFDTPIPQQPQQPHRPELTDDETYGVMPWDEEE